ncbi:tyrosine-protein kinase STYK1 [Microcaecilia unicolor]|uniref:Tyrosine-protein kinase STYK1-like n=1 Tax=Microcaecilia unicolor TaxID=1415580 RepID=A0A6P7WNG3_9AMPH|nr:tyrosine-protein kinase STYK1-like [Microcaecilia unicolor]XP_030041896.1 tyrosine-protein kinase STYK1-like [Microcaecilia unicolor]XP_030041897.1 tyrosine-protein kinase STYK1-like [Microcaecilia unicolor]XP_030041898.1 tyrosine-protein kinase STYK1-like [Microcaecilia unicolor]XP_030041899.1 tyrosine-protein kinase STYK1-like [Microcaecilia unicolor]XP_030041900.1 tyrosine-protein kinase STYK1-like [Microcaecilia unicolor]XP_030041901.1 tyrosine-protein kinase STYK1-like [Microcaecilia 
MGSAQHSCNFTTEDFRCNEDGTQNAVIVTPVFLVVSTLVVIVLILWKTCRKKRGLEEDPIVILAGESLHTEGREYGTLNPAASVMSIVEPRDPLLEQWELPKDRRIQGEEFLCQGRYGPICHATVSGAGASKNGQTVILRTLSEKARASEVKDFLNVVKFHIQICNHDNLVKTFWCQTEAPPLRLILKAMSLGNLLHFLWNSREGDQTISECALDLTEKSVFSMALQVARGLEYLIGMQKLIHGYVAACNVLIHEDMTIRLCGLGMAAEVYQTKALSSGRAAEVPLKWLAPERIMKRLITERSEVWSFGILLYEMITLGSAPYPDLHPADVLPSLQRQRRMPQPGQCGSQLYGIMKSCWHWKASNRPGFSELIRELDSQSTYADAVQLLTNTHTLDFNKYQRIAGLVS